MHEVITRHCLSPTLRMIQYNVDDPDKSYIADREEFIELIDRWKMIFLDKYKVQPGQTIVIVGSPTTMQYAATIAATELGLILITEWPVTITELDFNTFKVAMTEPLDFMITERQFHDPASPGYIKFLHKRDLIWCKNIIYADEFDSYNLVDHDFYKKIPDIIWARPDLIVNQCSTTGTTGEPKKISLTHKEVYLNSKRMAGHFDITSSTKVMHQNNIQHGWATLVANYFPCLTSGGDNYIYSISKLDHVDKWPEFIIKEQLNQIYLPTPKGLLEFLSRSPVYQHPVRITTLGFISTEAMKLAKEKNIECLSSTFGDNTLGAGFFIKRVNKHTNADSYDSTNFGLPSDDFYQLDLRDGFLYVACETLGRESNTSYDRFEIINGEWWFRGRGISYRINDQWYELRELDDKLLEIFGDAVSATVVVDAELEKIYLAIWKPNPQAEQEFYKFIKKRFNVDDANHIVAYVLRGFSIEEFSNERKVDNPRIRTFCRNQLRVDSTC